MPSCQARGPLSLSNLPSWIVAGEEGEGFWSPTRALSVCNKFFVVFQEKKKKITLFDKCQTTFTKQADLQGYKLPDS